MSPRRPFPARVVLVVALVAALASSAAVATPRSSDTTATQGQQAGFAMGGPWTWLTEAEQARDLDQVAATGARWIRVSFPWSGIQPHRTQYNWKVHDRIVRLARERGLQIIANVAYTPHWARPADCDSLRCAPADPGAYADFVATAVDRYAAHGVGVWEIWNEPNLSSFWAPRADPVAYAELLDAAHAAAKGADPDVTVLTGGLAPKGANTVTGLKPMTFLEGMYGALDTSPFDGLALHPYTYPRAPTDYHEDNLFTMGPRIRDLMVANGDRDKKIWITEFGWWTSPRGDVHFRGSVTKAEQERYLVEAYEAVAGVDWVGPTLWFTIRDTGTGQYADYDRDASFGLLEQDGSSKPAHAAFTEVMARPVPDEQASPAPTPTAPGDAPDGSDPLLPGLAPLASGSAVDTGVALSRHVFTAPGSAQRVVLVGDHAFPDALAAQPLAGTDGPIVFVPGGDAGTLPANVRTELARVLAPGGTVHVVGGPLAVAPRIADQLRAAGHRVERTAGADRIETALAVARKVAGDASPRTVLLARADAWPDAVAAGAHAAATRTPLVLSWPGELPDAVAAQLRTWAPDRVTALGGPVALSDDVVASVPAPTSRVEGAERADTAAQIARELWGRRQGGTHDGWVFIDGYSPDGWQAALAAGPLSARTGSPALLLHPSAVPDGTAAYLRALDYAGTTTGSRAANVASVDDGLLDETARLLGLPGG